jgi:hypothetical protein
MTLILFLCTFAARVGSRYEWGQKVVVIFLYDNGRYSSVVIAVSSVQKKCMASIQITAV